MKNMSIAESNIVRQHHPFKELNDIKPVKTFPSGATIA